MSARTKDRTSWWWVVALWVVATLVNAPKAVHIDDTAYLETAQWIRAHPLRPLSGTINWNDRSEPIHALNQPPLVAYGLAGASAALGTGETVLHLAHALYTALAAACFFSLARSLSVAHAVPFTAMFLLGPHLLPAQNLMTDVPMVALWLGTLLAVWQRPGHPIWGGVAAGAAVLTKYTSLVLLVGLAAVGLARRWREPLVTSAIGLLVLVAWSLFNYLDYGGIHLLDRPSDGLGAGLRPDRVAAWIICLGAVSPFSVLGIPCLRSTRGGRMTLGVVAGLGILTAALGPVLWSDGWARSLLRGLFVANGLLVTAGLVAGLVTWRRQDPTDGRWRLLGVTALGAAVFVIGVAPFLATRHVMPVAVVFLLTASRSEPRPSRRLVTAALIGTIGLGGMLAATDHAQADVYRRAARHPVAVSPHGTVHTVGHWGWQWYAMQAGMRPYEPGTTELRDGDLLVIPTTISSQRLTEEDSSRLVLADERSWRLRWETGLRTMTPQRADGLAGGYYSSGVRTLPWTFGTGEVERVRIYRCCATPESAR